jgi:Flp pilus assembly protein TadG
VNAVGVAERGGAPAVEAALLAVVFGLVIALAIAGGRLVAAESAADHAARAAARIASAQRNATEAERAAEASAQATLTAQGLACVQLQVTVDTTQFARPIGEAGVVRAEVSCSVRWSDLALPGAPGTRAVSAVFTSPIDSLRERGP